LQAGVVPTAQETGLPISGPDYAHLSFKPELRDAVRALCQRFDLPYWDACDAEHRFPEEFYRAFVKDGYMGTLIPEEYGGGGGSTADMITILEEIGAGGGALNACSSVHVTLIAVPSLLAFGDPEQRARLLPRIASGDLYITFGVTEPDAGTDTTQIRMRADKVDGGWLLNGTKVWNSGALRGDMVMALVRTSPPSDGGKRAEGMSLMLADLAGDSVQIRPIQKIGRNAVESAELTLNNHFVPDENVVGTVGQGFYHLLHSLNSERLYVAAEAIGIARWSVAAAAQYANERVVFDRQIGRNQAVQHPLAKSYLEILAAAQVVYRAVEELEARGAASIGTLANGAKYLASEAAFNATDAAMQVFGGFAYAREYHIGRHFIESRLPRLAPINNQMVLNYISERALKLPRSY
jgi:acyl-CoA dehydrogenase